MGLEFSPFGVTDDGLKNVTHLTGIETLDLRNSDLTDAGLSSVGRLKNLTVLNCNSCLLNGTGLCYLSGLTKLSSLSLSKNQLNDRVLSILPSLPRLQYLQLRRCSISDACLGYVAKLPQLERLDLSDNRGITSKGMAQLHALDKLQVLRIDNTMIRPNDAAVFKQFKSLKTVLIGGANFDSSTVSAWQKELPHVGIGLAPGQSKLQTQMPAEIFRPLH
jgi:internalin A